jgi:hypothetical protein
MVAISTKTRQTDLDAAAAAQRVEIPSVLELVLLRVRLRARRRAAWLAYLGGSAEAEALQGLDANLAACLGSQDTPEAEAAWYERAEVVQPLNEDLDRVERALAGSPGARL